MRRVRLHSGGISTTEVRAGTGGRKPSQWRTEIKPPAQRPRRSTPACLRCAPDERLVAQAEAFLKEHKQPPLRFALPVQKGVPGSNLRRKGQRRSRAARQLPMQEVASGEEDAEAPDIYAKGSYANNTNVRRDSDVDIVVENREDPLSGLPGPGKSRTARRPIVVT
jgi:hypothetical protein